jgi:lipoic acid synthetase
MILGDKCTRGCRFCAVETAQPEPPQEDEPARLAQAVARLGLRHVVITAVARDDLEDEGAGHFARCVVEVRRVCPEASVEVLPADFHARRDCIRTVCDASPDVYNHNLEVVERLTPLIRPQAAYPRSLEALRIVKEIAPSIITKSGLMVGLGETVEELVRTFLDLRGVGVDVLTIGQYLAPSAADHAPVVKYYPPEAFKELAERARSAGFLHVASGPFVRSSYDASDALGAARRRLGAAP